MSRISKAKNGIGFYEPCNHFDSKCRACRATLRHYSSVATAALDRMADMSDEALRVFLAVCRVEEADSPFKIIDREVLQRITGMSLDRVELGLLENSRNGVIHYEEVFVAHGENFGGARLSGGYLDYFADKAPAFTTKEFIAYLDTSEPVDNGFVYVIGAGGGFYKIGKTVNPEARLRSYATHLPEHPELIALFKVNSMNRVEEGLHEYYLRCHVRREWFRLPEAHVEWLYEGRYRGEREGA